MFLNFFDEVYVINLPHRLDRREQMEDLLGRHGIPFTFFSAIRDDNGIKGLVETMKLLLQHAINKRQNNVLIFEDDISFEVPAPVEFLREVLPQLPTNYHLFYLGLNFLTRPERISNNILKVKDCYSTHAICYSAAGLKFTLERLLEVPMKPYDIFMREEIVPAGAAYCTYPMLATQRDDSYSDIEKSMPNWGKLMKQTYAQHTRNLTIMAQEYAYCINGHEINGMIPAVDPTKFELQNPDLVGKTCDCGRFVYDEGKCPTCSGEKWKVIWNEKQG